jgi:calcineurin-like phosphoesterase family protein
VPRTWFTADFHLGHSNIIQYCNRPFAHTTEMDAAILARLNAVVKAEDELYYLGDFCMGGPKVALAYRERIRCRRIYFILGNHDRVIPKIADQFTWVKELAEVTVRNHRIVLCHYAMRTWHQAARGAWHLYGHSHGNLPPLDGSRSLDVGVDTHDFQPYSFEDLRGRLGAEENGAPD